MFRGYSCLLPFALVVRYGADYLNAGYKVQDEGKSAPNAPYWTAVIDSPN
ncbi:hypothetical protein [Moorena sp. SIO3A2]|nr:hypothetical protein [Moorena sp. SIO3A2]NER86992.1 hypothetical protein [Moorena sp. SIO3A2]